MKNDKAAAGEGVPDIHAIAQQYQKEGLDSEADFSKARSLDLVGLLQERSKVLSQRAKLAVDRDADAFKNSYQALHARRLLESKVSA